MTSVQCRADIHESPARHEIYNFRSLCELGRVLCIARY